MAKIAIAGSSTGTATYTIQSPSGSTDRVLTLPDEAGTVLTSASTTVLPKGGPAFSAYSSTNQTINDATQTKILFDTELFDTNSNFASSRFTPTVEGYYQINATVTCTHSSIVDFVITIYKNGSFHKRGFGFAGSGQTKFIAPVSALIYCNGTTDYIEIYCYSDGSGSATVIGSSNDTWFDGVLVRAA